MSCKFWYQLKGQQSRIGERINAGAYTAMMEAIQTDRMPNFYFLHYRREPRKQRLEGDRS